MRIDLSLALKRAVFETAGFVSLSPLGLWPASVLFHAADPEVAWLAGEELVSQPRRVLAFTAHPDDLEFFAGGTLRRLALNGSEITAVILTDGEKRGNRPGIAETRREEQRRAGGILGYRQVDFAGLPDFGLPEDPRLEQVVGDWLRRARPDVVLAFDPKELLPRMANRDHKALGRTVADAVRAMAGTSLRVYFYGTHHANTLLDITPVMADKEAAVRCHDSQLTYLPHAGYARGARQMARATALQLRGIGAAGWGGAGASRGPVAPRYCEALFRLM